MKIKIIFAIIFTWLLVLSVFSFALCSNTAQIKVVAEKQFFQENLMLKQAQILAVNTSLLQALFGMYKDDNAADKPPVHSKLKEADQRL